MKTANTVGQLIDILSKYPKDKPIILDIDGNTGVVKVYNWTDAPIDDLNWPIAIDGSELAGNIV